MLLYFPLVCLWLLFLYTLLLLGYIVSHPEVIIKSLFRLLDLAPAYGLWAGQKLFDQLSSELAERIR